MCSSCIASSDEAEWYFEGSGVPVGWKDGAVAFKVVVLPFVWPLSVVAIGAMLTVYI